MTDYCKKCGNVLEMTRDLPILNIDSVNPLGAQAELLNTETPADVSTSPDEIPEGQAPAESKVDSDAAGDGAEAEIEEPEIEDEDRPDTDEFYETILRKIEQGETLDTSELVIIDIKRMIKTPYYRSLKSKSVVKKKILDMIEDMGNSDNNVTFHLFCSSCGYHRKMDSGFHILSKNPAGVASRHDYVNEANIRNIVHFGIYPRTREFVCPNKDCDSHKKDHKTEACFMRENTDSYKTLYVCTTCLTIKRL